MAGLICAGDLFIDVLDDSMNSTGFLPVVNATKLAISARGAETKERKSKMRASYGQVLDSVSSPNPHEVAIDFDDLSGQILALAFSGVLGELDEDAADAEAVDVVAKLGNWVEIGIRNITALVVKEDKETDPATYVADTDYEINTRLGLIRALPDGGIEDGDTLKLTVTSGAVTGERVGGAMRSQINVRLVLDGRNLANGEDIVVRVPRATLNADNEVDFLSDDYAGVSLSGICVVVEGEDAPYSVERPKMAVVE